SITTDPSLHNLTSGYEDFGGNTDHTCLILLELTAIAAVCMAISLCGLVGNSLVLWFLDFHVKHSSFTKYFANLVAADFTLLLVVFLLMLAVLRFSTFCLHDLIPLYIQFVFAAMILVQYLHIRSLGILTAKSVDQSLHVL
ncbi:MRGX2 protein, partial [Tricholaema leucomelas]|nr:MRGX2 protein [Tricholaema leucomelas]